MSTNTTSHWLSLQFGIGRSRRSRFVRGALSALTLTLLGVFSVGTAAASAALCPSLGIAAPFAVLGGAGVTTIGGSSVVGIVGSAASLDVPTTTLPSLVDGLLGTVDGLLGGNDVVADTVAQSAVGAAASAYQSAAVDVPTHVFPGGALVNVTLTPGVYAWPGSLSLGGLVTLDALGQRNGDFVFQIPGNLVTAARAVVSLKGGAQAGNVLWQVGGAATLAPSTSLVGTILADHDITLGRGTSLLGRAQSLTGLVNLDASTVTLPRVLAGVSATVGTVASRATTVVPSGSTSTIPSGATTTCTCAATSSVPTVLPLIPLSAIAAPDLAVPSAQVGEASGLVSGLVGVVPLREAISPVGTNANSGSSVSVPAVGLPFTTALPIAAPLSAIGLSDLVFPAASSSAPSVNQLVPNLSLPDLVAPAASSLPSVSGLAQNLSLPSLVTPSTATPSANQLVPNISLPDLVSPASSSLPSVSRLAPNLSLPSLVTPSTATPSAHQLIPNLSLPSLATPSIPSISLPRMSTPLSSTSPGGNSLIRVRAKPSSPISHPKASAHAKSTTTTTVPSGTSIPIGAPATGDGGQAGLGWGSRMLVALGALVLAVGSAVLGARRRRVHG